jgi:peptide/nickel transport system substrate-binding protein
MRLALILLTLSLLSMLALGAVSAQTYQPPHSQPGPASDILRFRAVSNDVASNALRNGDIDMYVFSLKTEAAKQLEGAQGVATYNAPASTLSLILNPAPAPGGDLNPFSIKEVRRAVQHIIDRQFISQEIYQGLAQPMVTHVSPSDYDYLDVAALAQEFDIAFDPQKAKEMVDQAMTAAGATLSNGKWSFNGRPIQLKFIIRVEDERRQIGDLVSAELDKLGFTVSRVYHQFAPAVLNVYSTDPQQFQWHLYTEGWGRGAAERYDYATINQMSAPWLGNMPGWQEVGFWQYDNDKLDELGQRIYRGQFADINERTQLYQEMTRLSLDESIRLWVATVANTFPATDKVHGVTQDIAAGPKALWTLREAYIEGQQEITVGNEWVWTERTTWNPEGGFGDVYSVDIWRNIFDPPTARHPFTGLPIPFRVSYQVETSGPSGKLAIPGEAVLWDAPSNAFKNVASGAQATSKVTFDFSKYFNAKWHNGQPITMADVLYSIYQGFDIAYNPNKANIEFAQATTSKPYLETIKGYRIVDSSHLEVYVDYWHFVPDYIAEYATPTSLTTPWEMLAAMDDLVFAKRRLAYSDTAAQRFGVDWLSLVLGNHALQVRNTLREFQTAGRFPENVFNIGGTALVTRDDALARYTASSDWINQRNLAVISNGPYMLTRFDAPAQFAELEAYRDPTYPFKPGDWHFGAPPAVAITNVRAPVIGKGFDGAVDIEAQGPGALGVKYRLFDPVGNRLAASGDAQSTGDGQYRISLTEDQTDGLNLGLYQLYVTAFSDQVSALAERRVNLEVAERPGEASNQDFPIDGQPPAADDDGGGSGIILIAVVAVALVALLGVGGFFLMRMARRPTPG